MYHTYLIGGGVKLGPVGADAAGAAGAAAADALAAVTPPIVSVKAPRAPSIRAEVEVAKRHFIVVASSRRCVDTWVVPPHLRPSLKHEGYTLVTVAGRPMNLF